MAIYFCYQSIFYIKSDPKVEALSLFWFSWKSRPFFTLVEASHKVENKLFFCHSKFTWNHILIEFLHWWNLPKWKFSTLIDGSFWGSNLSTLIWHKNLSGRRILLYPHCAIFKMNAFDRKLFKSLIDVINNKNEILEIVKNSIANLFPITKEVFFTS